MCLKDASMPNISAISEKSIFRHIFADINDITSLGLWSFISFIYVIVCTLVPSFN